MPEKKDDKHVDKFGYASLMVGDSAALFNQHLNEYGAHYGTAAQNIGDFFTLAEEEGQAYRAMVAAQRWLEAGRNILPFVAVGSVVSALGTCAQTAAIIQQSNNMDRMVRVEESQLRVNKAMHLLNLSTRKEYMASILDTSKLYMREENADLVYLVLADSYISAQMKLFLDEQGQDDVVKVFDTIQDAFEDLSQRKDAASSKVLVYFHSLERIRIEQELNIHNCDNFFLRSDASQAYLEPRLVLARKLNVMRSSGTIRSVAVTGGFQADNHNHISFIKCTSSVDAVSFWDPMKDDDDKSSNGKRRKSAWPFVFLAAVSLVAIISTTLLMGGKDSGNKSEKK